MTNPTADQRFGPPRLQPHADFINSKNHLGYAITDLVKEFCAHHDLMATQVEIVVTHAGCFAKVTL